MQFYQAAFGLLGAMLAVYAVFGLFSVWIYGHGLKGFLLGPLLDGEGHFSTSRLQLIGWTSLVLGAMLAALIRNTQVVSAQQYTELIAIIPPGVLTLIGISTGSALTSSAIKKADSVEITAAKLSSTTGLFRENMSWSQQMVRDLLHEDQIAMTGELAVQQSPLSLGKIQMLIFSGVALIAYFVLMTQALVQFANAGIIMTSLPDIGANSSLSWLLGISHFAYLGTKLSPGATVQRPPDSSTPMEG